MFIVEVDSRHRLSAQHWQRALSVIYRIFVSIRIPQIKYAMCG